MMRAPAITHRPVGLNSGVYSRIVFWLTSLIGFPVFCVSRRLFAFSLSLSLSVSLSLFFGRTPTRWQHWRPDRNISFYRVYAVFIFFWRARARFVYRQTTKFQYKNVERTGRACVRKYLQQMFRFESHARSALIETFCFQLFYFSPAGLPFNSKSN